jgi:D-alanyl-D-alanine carboxypeptidase
LAFAATLAVALVLGVFVGTASAQQAGEFGDPDVAARAWVLTDLKSGEYLAGEDASKELPIASTTKIMEAIVVLENADPGKEVTVSREAASYATPAYSNVGLLPGDTLSVRELLMAALISSGDAAAYALAEHAGGEAGVNGFVDEMNEKAEAPYRRNEVVDLVARGDVAGLLGASPDVEREVDLVDHPPFRQSPEPGLAGWS